MRPDMDKVIVERPRIGGGARRPKGTRKREQQAFADLEPSREGYRRRWTTWRKTLNEHLSPLRRYLQSQIGRPWNKVHSEISRHLRLDSAVQSHVLDHLADYVEVNTRLVDGVVCNSIGTPIGQGGWPFFRTIFYVCPKSGLLKAVRRASRKRRTAQTRAYLVVGERRQWHQLGGHWFEIELKPATDAHSLARDVLLKANLGTLSRQELIAAYGGFQYATSKRQLGKREVRIAQRRLEEEARMTRR
jgi:hypothetical protein